MIEKIPFETEVLPYKDKTIDVQTHASPYDLQIKINELVDAVNKLDALLDLTNTAIQAVKNETPADPYAEQRKWIGKLCRFWNKTEYTDDLYGFLTDIVPTNKYKPEDNYFVPFKDEFGSFYEHCEPVKPDDDIIYKGE